MSHCGKANFTKHFPHTHTRYIIPASVTLIFRLQFVFLKSNSHMHTLFPTPWNYYICCLIGNCVDTIVWMFFEFAAVNFFCHSEMSILDASPEMVHSHLMHYQCNSVKSVSLEGCNFASDCTECSSSHSMTWGGGGRELTYVCEQVSLMTILVCFKVLLMPL